MQSDWYTRCAGCTRNGVSMLVAAGVRGCTRGGDCIRVNGIILSCGSTRGSGCTCGSV